MTPYALQNLPLDERPRERLMRHGPESMSAAELIAIILGSGMKGRSVLHLSQDILSHFGSLNQLAEATVEELCQIKGIGKIKALQLKAIFSLGTRMTKQAAGPKYRIDHPLHAYNLVKEVLEHEKREMFFVVLQDVKGCVICYETVSIGTLSNSLVHPREVFYPAIRHKASSMILVHNHPSGDPTPSPQDISVTKSLADAGRLMGIPINDHIIIGDACYTSLRQQGLF